MEFSGEAENGLRKNLFDFGGDTGILKKKIYIFHHFEIRPVSPCLLVIPQNVQPG